MAIVFLSGGAWAPSDARLLRFPNINGCLIGLSGNLDFADGGSISVPTFGFVDSAGNWAVVGGGVSPDIEVIDRLELVAAGHARRAGPLQVDRKGD